MTSMITLNGYDGLKKCPLTDSRLGQFVAYNNMCPNTSRFYNKWEAEPVRIDFALDNNGIEDERTVKDVKVKIMERIPNSKELVPIEYYDVKTCAKKNGSGFNRECMERRKVGYLRGRVREFDIPGKSFGPGLYKNSYTVNVPNILQANTDKFAVAAFAEKLYAPDVSEILEEQSTQLEATS